MSNKQISTYFSFLAFKWREPKMNKRTCHVCNRESYSAITAGKWLCPYCNADLSAAKAEPAFEQKIAAKSKNARGRVVQLSR